MASPPRRIDSPQERWQRLAFDFAEVVAVVEATGDESAGTVPVRVLERLRRYYQPDAGVLRVFGDFHPRKGSRWIVALNGWKSTPIYTLSPTELVERRVFDVTWKDTTASVRAWLPDSAESRRMIPALVAPAWRTAPIVAVVHVASMNANDPMFMIDQTLRGTPKSNSFFAVWGTEFSDTPPLTTGPNQYLLSARTMWAPQPSQPTIFLTDVADLVPVTPAEVKRISREINGPPVEGAGPPVVPLDYLTAAWEMVSAPLVAEVEITQSYDAHCDTMNSTNFVVSMSPRRWLRPGTSPELPMLGANHCLAFYGMSPDPRPTEAFVFSEMEFQGGIRREAGGKSLAAGWDVGSRPSLRIAITNSCVAPLERLALAAPQTSWAVLPVDSASPNPTPEDGRADPFAVELRAPDFYGASWARFEVTRNVIENRDGQVLGRRIDVKRLKTLHNTSGFKTAETDLPAEWSFDGPSLPDWPPGTQVSGAFILAGGANYRWKTPKSAERVVVFLPGTFLPGDDSFPLDDFLQSLRDRGPVALSGRAKELSCQ